MSRRAVGSHAARFDTSWPPTRRSRRWHCVRTPCTRSGRQHRRFPRTLPRGQHVRHPRRTGSREWVQAWCPGTVTEVRESVPTLLRWLENKASLDFRGIGDTLSRHSDLAVGACTSWQTCQRTGSLCLRIQYPDTVVGLEGWNAADLSFAFHDFFRLLPPQLG